jgi:hypothetical protein
MSLFRVWLLNLILCLELLQHNVHHEQCHTNTYVYIFPTLEPRRGRLLGRPECSMKCITQVREPLCSSCKKLVLRDGRVRHAGIDCTQREEPGHEYLIIGMIADLRRRTFDSYIYSCGFALLCIFESFVSEWIYRRQYIPSVHADMAKHE